MAGGGGRVISNCYRRRSWIESRALWAGICKVVEGTAECTDRQEVFEFYWLPNSGVVADYFDVF
jgi:hypothetical protein